MSPELPAEVTEHVRRLVDTFPPLSAEQRDRIAALLRGPRQPAVPAPRKRRKAVQGVKT